MEFYWANTEKVQYCYYYFAVLLCYALLFVVMVEIIFFGLKAFVTIIVVYCTMQYNDGEE